MATIEAKRADITRTLVQEGYDDVLVLDHDTATRVLTEKRRELLERIRTDDVESVRRLADELGRDKAAVSRDLNVLFEYDLVEYETSDQRKVPVLKHETVVVEPIV